MEPAMLVGRLASTAARPLLARLFVKEPPGAALVDRPMRISGFVSFRGEKRTLTEKDVRRIARRLVTAALRTGESPVPYDERAAVTDAVTATLSALGEITLTDVEAVRLGSKALLRELKSAAGDPERHLSADAAYLYERLCDDACAHILDFFTRRSAFIARSHVEETRLLAESIAKLDALLARIPFPGARDPEFEQRYFAYVETRHGKLTIFGIDLTDSPRKWPVDAAYLSLQALQSERTARLDFTDALPEALHGARRVGAFPDTAVPQPADRALAAHERVLLRGVAGSGKTTLVQWLALSAARQSRADPTAPADGMAYLDDRVPFVLPLRSLTRHGERLPSGPGAFLTAVGCAVAGEAPDGWATRVLRAGRGLLLVDGIDEIPAAERPRARAWLSELIDLYPGNRWLVTSRDSAVPAGWLAEEGFFELALAPMRNAEVASFIGRWHGAARTGDPEEDALLATYESKLLHSVRTKPELGRLATNPLMCGLICALQRERRGYLPQNRRELYRAALSMLLVRRDRERDLDVPEVSEEALTEGLQRLAYHLILNGRTELDRERAESIVARALDSIPELRDIFGTAAAVCTHLLERSGLLTDPDPQTLTFVHRTFQDYLGARNAVSEGDFGVLGRHATDDQWEDVIRMAVGHANPRERAEIFEELLGAAERAGTPADRNRAHLVAAAALEEARAGLSGAVRERVQAGVAGLIPPQSPAAARELAEAGPIVLDLLPGPEELDDDTAMLVVSAASLVRDDRALPFLTRYVDHPSPDVRRVLIDAWSQHDTERYATDVIAHVDTSDIPLVLSTEAQLEAAHSLGPRPRLEIQGGSTGSIAAQLARVREELVDLCLWNQNGLDLDAVGLDALHALRTFTLARVEQREFSLRSLSRQAPLDRISLLGVRLGNHQLRPLRSHPSLRHLLLMNLVSYTAEDWADLAALVQLSTLSIDSHAFDTAPETVRLPSVSLLWLYHSSEGRTGLRRLPELFPSLRTLVLDHWPEGDDPTGLDRLPDHINVIRR